MGNTYEVEVRQEGIRLDQVIFGQLGSLDKFEKILELNPHVLHSTILDQGVKIKIPVPEIKDASQESKIVKARDLW